MPKEASAAPPPALPPAAAKAEIGGAPDAAKEARKLFGFRFLWVMGFMVLGF